MEGWGSWGRSDTKKMEDLLRKRGVVREWKKEKKWRVGVDI